jgi:hypothetical protein
MKFFPKKFENNTNTSNITASNITKKNFPMDGGQFSNLAPRPFLEPCLYQDNENQNLDELKLEQRQQLDSSNNKCQVFKESTGGRFDFSQDYLITKSLNNHALQHYLLKFSELTNSKIYTQSLKNYLKFNKKLTNKRKGKKIILIHDSFMNHRSKTFLTIRIS